MLTRNRLVNRYRGDLPKCKIGESSTDARTSCSVKIMVKPWDLEKYSGKSQGWRLGSLRVIIVLDKSPSEAELLELRTKVLAIFSEILLEPSAANPLQ